MRYTKYSDALKKKYGEKIYKVPVNVPGTCPNRDGTCGKEGCIYCSEIGTAFESEENSVPIGEQLRKNMDYIGNKYRAKKYIAYFQNYTNTYVNPSIFQARMRAACIENIIGISVSTRPDCISRVYLDSLKIIHEEFDVDIEIELGLQSVNENTLKVIRRGHSLADFVDAVKLIHTYDFSVCVHLIGNLPWDKEDDLLKAAALIKSLKIESVKVHSLYILKNTILAEWYKENRIEIISPEKYLEKLVEFVRYLPKEVSIQRLFGRAPKEETLFCNWGMSWRKLQNQFELIMEENDYFQGDLVENHSNID